MPSHDPFAPSSGARLDSSDAPAEEQASPEAEVPSPEPQADDVPKGTVKELEDWVGDDKDRAQAVLLSENESGEPRKSLVKAMEDLLAAE